MNKRLKITLISTAVAASSLFAVVSAADAGWGGYQGRCDRAAMGDYAGPGMMNGMGKKGQPMNRNLDLSADEAKTLVAARLIMRGNDRLKVGQVTEQDENTYLVDIVTVDDSLVRQVAVDRNNGLPHGRRMMQQ
ncbi:MAG: hypothetical protein ABW101_18835 [Candidatus Thiodiazotropha sp.]